MTNDVVELAKTEELGMLVKAARSELDVADEASKDELITEDVMDAATGDEIAALDLTSELERYVDEIIDELARSALDVKSPETKVDISTTVLEGPSVETELLEKNVDVG